MYTIQATTIKELSNDICNISEMMTEAAMEYDERRYEELSALQESLADFKEIHQALHTVTCIETAIELKQDLICYVQMYSELRKFI